MASVNVRSIRTRIGQVVWLVCVLCALVLAAGALLISLQGSGTNSANSLYKFIVDTGDKLDFSVLSRENGLFDFVGKNSDTKDALANWGLAAIVWLVIGRIADRIIRP
jgi:hypothetical protein